MIVVGVDGTGTGLKAALWAADEAARRGDRILLVHVWDDLPCAPYAVHRPDQSSSQAALDRALDLVREHRPSVPASGRLGRGRPAEVLQRLAAGADLLVLGSGAHLAGDGRLGAVLLSCLRWPPCPIAVIQPSAALDQIACLDRELKVP